MNPEKDVTRLPDTSFEEALPLPANGKATTESVAHATKTKTLFSPVSRKTAEAAKKGTTSTSRTGKAKQITYEFNKPPRGIYVKVHPSPSYHTFNLPVFVNETEGTFHYISPELFESSELPERFRNACKIMDIHAAGLADGTFILWFVFVSSSKWRKAAVKAVEQSKLGFGIVTALKARQTYTFEPATEPIPEPKWESLPSFEQMLLDAFDSSVNVADDKVVADYMSGGVAQRDDETEDSE